ncbi:MAG: hypothetical protein FWC15_09515 [Fibromonadales bacterium]|nr:hypothetical protein [Fibromonadales bacterium]
MSYDTIDGYAIKTILYPYSINIINDSIMIVARWKEGDEEYRGKLTDEQYSEILKKVSELNQKYDYYAGRSARWTCMLEIDNQVHYIYRFCSHAYKFSHPKLSPMPKEIELLFQYIVGLSPIPIM